MSKLSRVMLFKLYHSAIFVVLFCAYSFGQEFNPNSPPEIEIKNGQFTYSHYTFSYKELAKEYRDITSFRKKATKNMITSTTGDIIGAASLGLIISGFGWAIADQDDSRGFDLIRLAAPVGLLGLSFKILSRRSKIKSIDLLNNELLESYAAKEFKINIHLSNHGLGASLQF